MKKKVLVTRKLLKENENKLKELFDVNLNDRDWSFSIIVTSLYQY